MTTHRPDRDGIRRARRNLRLQRFDYASAGAYFVTICTHHKSKFLSRIRRNVVIPSLLGELVIEEWYRSANLRREIELDEFILMPNHVHGIVLIEPSPCDLPVSSDSTRPGARPRSLSSFVAGFKSAATSRLRMLRGKRFRPWQRNFYDRVLRNLVEFERCQHYIRTNPENWSRDPLYR